MSGNFELGEEIAALATQVNVATHVLLTRIRSFDAPVDYEDTAGCLGGVRLISSDGRTAQVS
jgi:hypothetical protein